MKLQMRIIIIFLLVWLSTNANAEVYGVIVGVSKYSVSANNLRYATLDAIGFYNAIRKQNPSSPATNFTLLTDGDATLANINAALKIQFAKAQPEDKVIFFFSGHGSNGIFYTHESGSSFRHLSFTALRQVFVQCRAKTKLCIADACYSGSLNPAKNGSNQKRENNLSANQSDVIVFISSRNNQLSFEHPSLSNGLFSFYLLKGMRGFADANKDRKISAFEIFKYVNSNVRNFSNNIQIPQMFGTFPKEIVLFGY